MIYAAVAEKAKAEEAWWEEAKALEEIFEDWKETIAEEESAYDCSFEEAKALADDNDYGYDEHEEYRKAVRAELEAESEAERGYY